MDDEVMTLPKLKESALEWYGEWSKAKQQEPTAPCPGAKMGQEGCPALLLVQKAADGQAATGQAAMSAGVLAGPIEALDNFSIPVINVKFPVGSALVGGVVGIVTGDVVDLVFPRRTAAGNATLINVAVNIGAGAALLKWGPGLMGSTASKFAVGTLILKIGMRFLPIESWINQMTGAIASPLSGLGFKAGQEVAAGQSVFEQADEVVRNMPSKSAGYA